MHYARQKFYVIQLATRVDSDLSLSDQKNKNACDSPLNAKNVIIDVVVVQEKLL